MSNEIKILVYKVRRGVFMNLVLAIVGLLGISCFLAFAAESPFVIDTSTIALWKFDEGAGDTVRDESGKGHTGSLTSGVQWVTGQYGNAIYSNSNTDYMMIDNIKELELADHFKIEALVYIQNWDYYVAHPIYSAGIANKFQVQLVIGGHAQVLEFYTTPADTYVELSTKYNLPDSFFGKWQKIGAEYLAGIKKLYVNDKIVASDTVPPLRYPIEYKTAIGGNFVECSSWKLEGKIDEMKISVYNHDRVSLIPVLSPTLNRTPLMSWYKFKDADHYTIQVATDNSFRIPLTILPTEDTLYSPLVPLPIDTIFWRVSSNLEPDVFSVASSFIIQDSDVPIPTPFIPYCTTNRKPTFYWSTVPRAAYYYITIDTEKNFLTPEISLQTIATAFTPTVNLPLGTCYFKVKSNLVDQYSVIDSVCILPNTDIDKNNGLQTTDPMWRFPNPITSSNFVLADARLSNAAIKIFNLQGKKIFSKNVGEHSSMKWNLTKNPSGVYLVQIYYRGYSCSQKFVWLQ